jgi:catechol-2,3-dioxygenase
MPATRTFDRAAEDVGNIIALEHVNVTVPDQGLAWLFYVSGMGFTRDPYMDFGTSNMWMNVGAQQFHLPTNAPQVLRGHTGVVVPDLDGLRARLQRVGRRLAGTRHAVADHGDHLDVTCPWGNRIRAFGPGERFGDMTLGMPYVELDTRPGTAPGIAAFYRQVLGAPAAVERDGDAQAAVVRIGQRQQLRFRETPAAMPDYDGHHIAIYLVDFSRAHGWLAGRGLVSEESDAHQYRFRDIVHPETGEALSTIEHEVRSLHHPMWQRFLVNRNPAQSFMGYQRGRDAWPA